MDVVVEECAKYVVETHARAFFNIIGLSVVSSK
jgi:hypothetical protein